MAKFDVYALEGLKHGYVAQIQADILDDLETVVVVPIMLKEHIQELTFYKLMPIIEEQGREYIFMTTDLATIRRSRLGGKVFSISSVNEYEIRNALDFLLLGF